MLCKDTLFSAHSLLSPPVCRARLQDLKKRLIFADMIRILLSWALLLAAAIPTPFTIGLSYGRTDNGFILMR